MGSVPSGLFPPLCPSLNELFTVHAQVGITDAQRPLHELIAKVHGRAKVNNARYIQGTG